MPIRAISFDWGDTLAANHGQPYRFVHGRAFAAFATALRALGGTSDEAWASACEAALCREWRESVDPRCNPDNREFDAEALMAGWIHTAGLDPAAPGPRAARLAFAADCIETVVGLDGVAEALEQLAARGLRLGICSHVAWPVIDCRAWLARRGWDRFLSFDSFSSEVGWIKPHPQHFRHALERAGCAPQELLHVGDHPERDVRGARAAGLRTCLRITEHIYDEAELAACAPDATIAHVRELPALLDAGAFG